MFFKLKLININKKKLIFTKNSKYKLRNLKKKNDFQKNENSDIQSKKKTDTNSNILKIKNQ